MTVPALALALALGADPCLAEDAAGAFPTCFAPGAGLEVALGAAAAGAAPPDAPGGRAGALEARAAVRLRSDVRAETGEPEWLRDVAVLDAAARAADGGAAPRSASAVALSAVLVRRRSEPFLLVPLPRPVRLPFPLDVGLRLDAGGVAWDAARRDAARLDVTPLRAALLLDAGSRVGVRRAAFGPEVAWTVRVARGRAPVHRIVPFTGGAVDVRLETADGRLAATLLARGGAVLVVPGGTAPFVECEAGLERVVLAVNDAPVALYGAGAVRGGAAGRGAGISAGLRVRLFAGAGASARAGAGAAR